jgi:hypothetical protein
MDNRDTDASLALGKSWFISKKEMEELFSIGCIQFDVTIENIHLSAAQML